MWCRYADRRILWSTAMNELRSSQVRALLDFLDDLESVADEGEEALNTVLFEGLGGLVPSDSVWRADCDLGRVRNDLRSTDGRLGPVYESKQMRWWALVPQHPIIVHREETGNARAVKLSDVASRRSLRRLEIYDEFFHPYGIEYSMSIRIPLSVDLVVDIGCTRVSKDFTERDRALLDLTRLPLAHILRSAGAAGTEALITRLGLTAREASVLRLVGAGMSNAAVADVLFISSGTVRKHLEHIYAKLGVGNRTEAASWLSIATKLVREPVARQYDRVGGASLRR